MLRKFFLRNKMLFTEKLRELKEISGARMALNVWYYLGLTPFRSKKGERCGFGAFEKIVDQDDKVFWHYLRQIQYILLLLFRIVSVWIFLDRRFYILRSREQSEVSRAHLLLQWIVLHNVIFTGILRALSDWSKDQIAPFLNALTKLTPTCKTARRLSRKEDRVLSGISTSLFMGVVETQLLPIIDCKFNLLSFLSPALCEIEEKGALFWTSTTLAGTWLVIGIMSSLTTWTFVVFRILTIGTGVLDELLKAPPNSLSIRQTLHHYRSVELGIRCFDGTLGGALISFTMIVYCTLHVVYFNTAAVLAYRELNYGLVFGSLAVTSANFGSIFWGLKQAGGLHERSKEVIERLRTAGEVQGSRYLKKMAKSVRPLKLSFGSFHSLNKNFVLLIGSVTFELAANFILILFYKKLTPLQ